MAEQMFRHDPLTALYAPLRVVIHSHANDQAIFSIDQPSSVFASLGRAETTAVGKELDEKGNAVAQVITGQKDR